MDFLLIGLYLSWFYRIFIERSEPLPSLNFIDVVLFLFLLSCSCCFMSFPRWARTIRGWDSIPANISSNIRCCFSISPAT